jgi:hypothetical protein
MMKIRRLIEHYLFNKSVKEVELNKILDKVLKKETLTLREKGFIELYNSTQEVIMKDYLYLSKNSTFKKITEILEIGKKIICDLHDRNGKIGVEIIGIVNNFEQETCSLTLKSGEKHNLHDKFLYNLIYNIKKDQYSIEEQDEYFEKIATENEH